VKGDFVMANIKTWLTEDVAADGQTLEGIVFGRHYNDWIDDYTPHPAEDTLVEPEVGLAVLDEEFHCGHGGADCRPMFAWTATKVYFIHEYDGATTLVWVPRNPTSIAPEFGGQWK